MKPQKPAFILALVAAFLLVPGVGAARAGDHPETDHTDHHHWMAQIHLESEIEIALSRPETCQTLIAEGGLAMGGNISLTMHAMTQFTPHGPHIGGGIGLRFESGRVEALARIGTDITRSAFRTEVRGILWAHPSIGFMLRGLGESLPSPWSASPGPWSFIASGGLMFRRTHHLAFGLLATYRFEEAAHTSPHHVEDNLGIAVLTEAAFP